MFRMLLISILLTSSLFAQVQNPMTNRSTQSQVLKAKGMASTNWVITYTNTSRQFYAGVITQPTMLFSASGGITTMTIGNGAYGLYSSSNYLGVLKRYNIAGRSFTMKTNQNNYIVADYRSGTPALTNRNNVIGLKQSDIIPVYSCYLDAEGHTYSIDWDTMGRGLANRLNEKEIKATRFVRQSGLTTTERATKIFRISGGIVWIGADQISINSIDSTTNTSEFWYHNTLGHWTNFSVSTYTNGKYDSLTGLQNVGGGVSHWTTIYIYVNAGTNRYSWYTIGNADYTSLLSAQSSQPQSTPEPIASHGILVSRIIVQKGATTATEIDTAFNMSFGSSGTLNHNELANLDYASSGHTGFGSQTQITYLSNRMVAISNQVMQTQGLRLVGMASTNYVNSDVTIATSTWHAFDTIQDRTLTNGYRSITNGMIAHFINVSNYATARTNGIRSAIVSATNGNNKRLTTLSNHFKTISNSLIVKATNQVHSLITIATTRNLTLGTNTLHLVLSTSIANVSNASMQSYAMIWYTNGGVSGTSKSNIGTFTINTFPATFEGWTNNRNVPFAGRFFTGYATGNTNYTTVVLSQSNTATVGLTAWTNAKIKIGSLGAGTYQIFYNLTFISRSIVPADVAFIVMKNGTTPLYDTFSSVAPVQTALRNFPASGSTIATLNANDFLNLGVRTVLGTARIGITYYNLQIRRIK